MMTAKASGRLRMRRSANRASAPRARTISRRRWARWRRRSLFDAGRTGGGQVAEAAQRLGARLVRRVAHADQLLGAHLDVEPDLLVDPGLDLARLVPGQLHAGSSSSMRATAAA